MNVQFITADEARTKTNENLNSLENPFLRKIFEDGIYPAIEEGKFNCSVEFSCNIPHGIISILQEKGYYTTYGRHVGSFMGDDFRNEKIINISW